MKTRKIIQNNNLEWTTYKENTDHSCAKKVIFDI
jgi:hypothetical protein